ncbi:MAG: FliA/WhiG family RNA polymerase sigma factor, partial [Desulfobulbaceae bacterium]|nr:FliA/WhiG family RNA polymerase sigma factor [Desulfobulbaceae bacterium]
VLGVSEGRVSQLHSQALLKLRVKLRNSDLYEP